MLINKLGDPDYQVASRIVYLVKNYCKYFNKAKLKSLKILCNFIFEIVTQCPKMKKDLLVEIERLVSRQNLNQRAQYASLI
jgi:hypothetical protein